MDRDALRGRSGPAQGALRGGARGERWCHAEGRRRPSARASPARSRPAGRSPRRACTRPPAATARCSARATCCSRRWRLRRRHPAAVATSLGIAVRAGEVHAEGDLDFRGTLAVDRDAPVGFTAIRLAFELDTDADAEQLATAAEADRALLRRLPDPGDPSPALGGALRRLSRALPGPLRHLGELARARARKGPSERVDGQALAELERRPAGLPAGLEVEWLGVSGYRLACEGQTLFIDPYLSRVPLREPAPAATGPAGPGGPRALPARSGRGRRGARRPHPLRPRGRRPGDRPPLRLPGLRLGLAGQPDGAARARRAGGRGRALPDLRARPVRGQLHAQRPLEAAARARRPLRRRHSPASTSTGSRPAPIAAARSGGSRSGRRDGPSTTRAAPT